MIKQDLADTSLNVTDNFRVLTFDNGQKLQTQASLLTGMPSVLTVVWLGMPYELQLDGVPENVKQQVLWELHELNFWFNLIRLNGTLSTGGNNITSALQRQERLMRCRASPQHAFYSPSNIQWVGKNVGLAESHLDDHICYLCFLYNICVLWPASPMLCSMCNINTSMENRTIVCCHSTVIGSHLW